jgi:uncharacterized membrane protein
MTELGGLLLALVGYAAACGVVYLIVTALLLKAMPDLAHDHCDEIADDVRLAQILNPRFHAQESGRE